MTRVVGVIAAVLALLASGLLTTSAEAAPRTLRAVIIFEKNYQRQFDSRVIWRLVEVRGDKRKVVETASWRAGGGLPRAGGKNACVRNTGWLPDGEYSVVLHRDYRGNFIKGRAFQLENKRCANGTLRQSLFLHTEQDAGSRQCPDRPGDQACRWEWPRINDYKSYGCIKVAPNHLKQLADRFERHFSAGVRYGKDRAVVIVR